MKLIKTLPTILLSALTSTALPADPIDNAIVAAMKLAETPNYSWICSVADDAQSYEIEGKTQLGGYTWQRQPMPENIARRLGRDAGHELEAIFTCPLDYVISTPDGWKTLRELPKRHDDWVDESELYYISVPIVRTPDMPADIVDPHAFGLPAAICVPVLREQQDEKRAYSNAQFALARPHDELAIIVSSHDAFQVEGDTVSGSLTDLGAQLLLVHHGHEYITPVIADGRFTLWINDGLVTKYVVELAGIVVRDKKPIYVRQKSTTIVKDVSTTHFTVPLDARKRLAP